MRISSPRLRRLDAALADLAADEDSDAMLISELDGYLAAIIVSPEPIPSGEWLPLVWSSDGTTVPFADEREAQWYEALVIEHYEAIARTLSKGPGRYVPFLEVDVRGDEVMWEIWIEGFEAAMRLRAESWAALADEGDDDTALSVAGLITLADIASDHCDLEREAIDELTEVAPGLIPRWVEALYAWRQAHDAAPAEPADVLPFSKVGRNDPCPCGSGKKYKKCCGLN